MKNIFKDMRNNPISNRLIEEEYSSEYDVSKNPHNNGKKKKYLRYVEEELSFNQYNKW